MDRQRIGTGTRWEESFGYSRAVRVGDHVFVAGTLATDDHGNIVEPTSAYAQAMHIFRKIERAMTGLGASLDDVVRTRMYVINISHDSEVGRAHQDMVGHVRPVATMIEVKGLAAPDALVEIEVDAIIGASR